MSFIKKFRGLVEITKVDDEQALTDLPKKEKKGKKTKATNASSETPIDTLAYVTDEVHIEKQKELKYKKKPTCMDHILFHEKLRLVYVLLLCLIIGLLIPYCLTWVFNTDISSDRGYCGLNISYRMECLPGKEIMNKNVCYTANCCYDSVVMDDSYAPLCFHSIPADYNYKIANVSDEGRIISPKFASHHSPILRSLGDKSEMNLYLTPNKPKTPYGKNASDLSVLIQRKGNHVVRIKIWNPAQIQDIDVEDFDPEEPTNQTLDVLVSDTGKGDGFNISVKRINGQEIFNTVFGPLIFSENYTEITGRIDSEHLYGLGQRGNLEFSPNFKERQRWALFNFESDTSDDATHSSHPFYMNIENDGNVHGVYLKNSAPIEIGVYPIPAVVFRTLGGSLDLRFFAGPTPQEVSRQYTDMIGKPVMPPYWALGYHLCRTALKPETEFENVYDGMEQEELPYESDCVDARLTYPGSFTNLSSTNWNRIQSLKDSGRKFWLVQYPFVDFESDAYNKVPEDLLLKLKESSNNTSTPYYGTVGGKTVGYLDYISNNLSQWLNNDKNISFLYLQADGVLLFKNSPLNEVVNIYNHTYCNETNSENCCPKFPMDFLPIGVSDINNRTICASAYHDTVISEEARLHVRSHNAYGQYHHRRIAELMKQLYNSTGQNKRTIVTSQSTHPGSGAFGGQFGGNYQPNLVAQQIGLTQILQMGLYGIPLTGIPICGSTNNSDGSLKTEWCLRAHQMSAFLPFAMNHYEYNQTARNPPDFQTGFMSQIKYFIRQRYMMIPYMYTLFYEAACTGVPVVRPLFYEFPRDKGSRNVMSQFLLGKGLMVSPAFNSVGSSDSVLRQAHFPPGCWYDFYKGSLISHSDVGQEMLLPTLLTDINVHILGGTIIPLQGSLHDNYSTTAETRLLPFFLMAALPCNLETPVTTTTQIPTEGKASFPLATGTLYMDDGETPLDNVTSYHNLSFTADASSLTITAETSNSSCNENFSTIIESVLVFGLGPISTVKVDGTKHDYHNQEADTHTLYIYNMTINWCIQLVTKVNWE